MTLTARSNAEAAEVWVRNEGIPKPADSVSNLFVLFCCLDRETDSRFTSLGLALTISKEIIMACQGAIEMRSSAGREMVATCLADPTGFAHLTRPGGLWRS